MSDRDRIHLEEMIAAIDGIIRQTADITDEAWAADEGRVAATSMFLIVLGEGARLLSPEIKAARPDVPWNNITGLRHRLAHGYFRANPRIIWRSAAEDAPNLRPTLVQMLAELGSEPD